MTQLILLSSDFIIFLSSFLLSLLFFPIEPKKAFLLCCIMLTIKIVLFFRVRLYKAILQFSGLPLAATIIKANMIASTMIFFIAKLQISQPVSDGFFVIDFFITTSLVGIIRFTPRYLSERKKGWGTKRILIYGAGELGEQVARKLLRNPGEYLLVGFLDDSPDKINKRLHNLPVFGPLSKISSILAQHRISELIIAISSMSGEAVRDITRECRRHDILCRIVPSFTDMFMKDVDIKNIDISDLLKREPKDLDEPQIMRFIKNKTIIITGAGGSIGSELSRQCLHYGAKRLILIDHSEFNLYQLKEELSSKSLSIRFCLFNILDEEQLSTVLSEEKPSLFFHAAAYKHVPIVEENPSEGIINNVLGTIRTSQLAETYGVEKYILISTDKAVRPTSIMGASKRIAELFIQNFNVKSKAEFVAVRFGNVLGSSGSVIPKFIDQINKGGPVTVTHPEVTRYFMLISEAVQLVLQAASIGNGGEIFILNMGHPIKIAEMAEDLIFLSGRKPHKDIKLEFIGLRSGEKLYEELLLDETEKKTQYENITIARPKFLNWDHLMRQIDSLLEQTRNNNRVEILMTIKNVVPEFMHSDLKITPPNKVVTIYS